MHSPPGIGVFPGRFVCFSSRDARSRSDALRTRDADGRTDRTDTVSSSRKSIGGQRGAPPTSSWSLSSQLGLFFPYAEDRNRARRVCPSLGDPPSRRDRGLPTYFTAISQPRREACTKLDNRYANFPVAALQFSEVDSRVVQGDPEESRLLVTAKHRLHVH